MSETSYSFSFLSIGQHTQRGQFQRKEVIFFSSQVQTREIQFEQHQKKHLVCYRTGSRLVVNDNTAEVAHLQ